MLMNNENLSPAFKIILQPAPEDDDSSGTVCRHLLEINTFVGRTYLFGW